MNKRYIILVLFAISSQMVFSQKISRIIPVENTAHFSSLGDHFCKTSDGYYFSLENYKEDYEQTTIVNKFKPKPEKLEGKLVKYSKDFTEEWSFPFDTMDMERNLSINYQTGDLLMMSTDFDKRKKIAKTYVSLIDTEDGQVFKSEKWWELNNNDFDQSKFTDFSKDGSLGVFTRWSVEGNDLVINSSFLNIGDLSINEVIIKKSLREFDRKFSTFLDKQGMVLQVIDKYGKFLEFSVFNQVGELKREINVPFDHLESSMYYDKDFFCDAGSEELSYYFGYTTKKAVITEGIDIWSLSKYRDSVAHVAYLDLGIDSELITKAYENYHLNFTNTKHQDKGFGKKIKFFRSIAHLSLSQVTALDDGLLIMLEEKDQITSNGVPITVLGPFIMAKIDFDGNIKWVHTFGRYAQDSYVFSDFSFGSADLRINGIYDDQKLRILYANGEAGRKHELIFRDVDLKTGEILSQEMLDEDYRAVNMNYSGWVDFNTFVGLFYYVNIKDRLLEPKLLEVAFPD